MSYRYTKRTEFGDYEKSEELLNEFDQEQAIVERLGEIEDFFDNAKKSLGIDPEALVSVLTSEKLYTDEGVFRIKGIEKINGQYAIKTIESHKKTYYLNSGLNKEWFLDKLSYRFVKALNKSFDEVFSEEISAYPSETATMEIDGESIKIPKISVAGLAEYKTNRSSHGKTKRKKRKN